MTQHYFERVCRAPFSRTTTDNDQRRHKDKEEQKSKRSQNTFCRSDPCGGGKDSAGVTMSETELAAYQQYLEERQAAESTAAETPTETPTEAATTTTTAAPTTAAPADDVIRPEFKAAMDSYEAFYNEYCDLLEASAKDPTNFTLLTKYAELLGKLDGIERDFKKWDDSSLSDAEMKYYIDVHARIEKRLPEAGGAM